MGSAFHFLLAKRINMGARYHRHHTPVELTMFVSVKFLLARFSRDIISLWMKRFLLRRLSATRAVARTRQRDKSKEVIKSITRQEPVEMIGRGKRGKGKGGKRNQYP